MTNYVRILSNRVMPNDLLWVVLLLFGGAAALLLGGAGLHGVLAILGGCVLAGLLYGILYLVPSRVVAGLITVPVDIEHTEVREPLRVDRDR